MAKGPKQFLAAVTWQQGKNVTVSCAESAAGNFIPSMWAYPRSQASLQLEKNGPVGAIYSSSKNW